MDVHATALSRAQTTERTWIGLLSDLCKARLTTLVLLTTAVGFYMGKKGSTDWLLLAGTLAGTALLAGGAAALNQYLERAYDALMQRTANRPLPAGRLRPESALLIGGLCSVAGIGCLALLANFATAIIGSLTLLSYLFVYTPLKRRSVWNTVVGAVPGALPPLMGWVAARGEINAEGWALFAILFCWQIPHFLAISWIYRADYARAGFQMLSTVDNPGGRLRAHCLNFMVALLGVSLLPVFLNAAGGVYLAGALAGGALFLLAAVDFAARLSMAAARRLFLASIVYLPVLLALMVMDKN